MMLCNLKSGTLCSDEVPQGAASLTWLFEVKLCLRENNKEIGLTYFYHVRLSSTNRKTQLKKKDYQDFSLIEWIQI